MKDLDDAAAVAADETTTEAVAESLDALKQNGAVSNFLTAVLLAMLIVVARSAPRRRQPAPPAAARSAFIRLRLRRRLRLPSIHSVCSPVSSGRHRLNAAVDAVPAEIVELQALEPVRGCAHHVPRYPLCCATLFALRCALRCAVSCAVSCAVHRTAQRSAVGCGGQRGAVGKLVVSGPG